MRKRDKTGKFIPQDKIEIICKKCGIKFMVFPFQSKKRHCSKICYGLWSESEENYLIKNYKSQTISEISMILNKSYYAITSKIREIGLRKRKSPEAPRITQCFNCGKLLKRHLGRGEKWGSFCSRKCQGAYLSGPRHPRWKEIKVMSGGYKIGTDGKYLHRTTYEQFYDIRLNPHNVIHHIDRDRANNAIENLVLCENQREHIRRFHMGG